MNDGEILDLIRADPWMMRVLGAAAALGLPDWMIGAGFVRNKVWDHLHGFANAEVRTADIDLIYFDPTDLRESTEKEYDRRLRAACDVNWSAKNQARMHEVTGDAPYTSAADGLAHWVEIGDLRRGDFAGRRVAADRAARDRRSRGAYRPPQPRHSRGTSASCGNGLPASGGLRRGRGCGWFWISAAGGNS